VTGVSVALRRTGGSAEQPAQRLEVRRVLLPAADGSSIDRLPHLHGARRGHRGTVALELEASRGPREPAKVDEAPRLALRVLDEVFVPHLRIARARVAAPAVTYERVE